MQKLVSADPNFLAVSIVTVEEQIKGHFKLIKQANSSVKLIRAYAALQSGVAYFNE
jgi:hypothetical protein